MKIGLLVFTANDRETYNKRSYDSIRAAAQQAESDGFDSIWLADHLLYRSPGEPTRGIWECWTMLGALAEATKRVEIGTLVTCNSFRNPAILAKMAITIDEISHGRLILGLGAGWNKAEYEAFGVPFDHRVDRLEEALHIIKPLLVHDQVDFTGKFYQVKNCDIAPRGPRPEGPPLLIGTLGGSRMLKLTAQYADFWNTAYFGKPETFIEPLNKFKTACQNTGRDPATIGITVFIALWFPALQPKIPAFLENPLTGSPREIAEAIRGYEKLGVQHIMFQCEPYTPESIKQLTAAVKLYHQMEKQ